MIKSQDLGSLFLGIIHPFWRVLLDKVSLRRFGEG
jgi:hypothetical protein